MTAITRVTIGVTAFAIQLLFFVPAVVAQSQSPEPPVLPPSPGTATPLPPVQLGDQPRPERPYQGVFGGGEGAALAPGLSLLADGYGGRDTNVLASQPGGGGTPFANVAGSYLGGAGTLNYLWARASKLFTTAASADVRTYPNLDTPATQSYSLTARYAFDLARRFRVALRQDVRYSSFYQLDPGLHAPVSVLDTPAIVPASPDRGLSGSSTYGLGSDIDLTQTLGPRTSLVYGYTHRRTHYESDGHEFALNEARIGFRRNMTRYSVMRLGYGYEHADYGDSAPFVMHDIDAGVDYSRPLSFSRRTRVGFSAGSTMFSREGVNFYRFVGTANVTHEIGRTWLISGAYDRGMQFTDVINEPLYSNSVTARAGGLAGRRIELTFDASYTTGQLTLSNRGRGLRTYAGNGQLQWAMSQRLAAYASYGYYHYAFGADVVIPTDVLRDVDRHSVRAGVRLWLPVWSPRQRGIRGLR